MRRQFLVWGVGTCAAAALCGAPAAFSATPQQIFRDYQQHGRFTHTYSRADLQRALRDTALQGYPHVGVQGAVQQALGARTAAKSGLPFTGLDLALMTVGGFSLLLLGAALRRFAGNKA